MAEKKTTTTRTTKIESPVKMPLTFKEFAKNPIVGLMFLCIIAVGYLYIDGRTGNVSQIKELREKQEKLETKVDQLTEQLRKSDSTLSSASSKIAVLQELGKIK
jgi:hypothetical protein